MSFECFSYILSIPSLLQATINGIPLTLMTSHLESQKNHATERKRQLHVCLDAMMEADSNRSVIFGGDLNLRDNEVRIDKIIVYIWDFNLVQSWSL